MVEHQANEPEGCRFEPYFRRKRRQATAGRKARSFVDARSPVAQFVGTDGGNIVRRLCNGQSKPSHIDSTTVSPYTGGERRPDLTGFTSPFSPSSLSPYQ